MSESKPASVVFTNAALLANKAQQTANQAVASAAKYKTAWEEANSENLAALSTAQSEFKSNLAWVKSQIYEGEHQNDSVLASLQSDMESSWNSMSTVEESLYNSASTATSEADSRLESLRAQNSQSMADLHSVANSLHAAANSLHADADSMRASMAGVASGLGKDITATRESLTAARNSLAAVDSSMRTATSEVADNLNSVKNSLAAVDADLRNGVKQAGADLANTKTSLTATGTSLATATSELQRKTGQISGSLSTADSMIMYNSNAIAEVKRTAGEISTTVSNIRVGGRNLLRNSIKFPYLANTSNSWTNGLWRIAGMTTDDDMKRVNKEIADSPCGKANAISFTGVLPSSINDISLVAINSLPISGKVTVSFWARQTSNVDTAFVSAGWSGMPMIATNASTAVWGTTRYRKLALPKDGSWTRFWATFDAFSGQNVYVGCGNTGASAEVQICLVKIETGTMATDWTPAPEDTDQAISKVSQTADAIRADLTNTKGDVTSVKATASSLQTQITDNKNNISSVKQTANSIESTVGQMPAKWQQAINDKASAQVLTSNVDMNNLTTAGTYLVKDFSAKNAPISAYFMATVDATADRTRVVQRVKKDTDNIAYERSNYDTGWTAWERVATGTDVSSIKQTMDSITTRVSNAEGNVSSLQQTANGLQASVANAQGEISNVKQTANKLQSDLANAKGDISSLQQTASGLTSRVDNAEGNISQLQQTANGLTSTVSNLHAGDRNYARYTFNEWKTFTGFTGATNYCTPSLGVFYLGDLKEGDIVTIGYTIKNSGIQSGKFWIQSAGNVSNWGSGAIGFAQRDIAKVCPDGTTTTIIEHITLNSYNFKNNNFDFNIRTDNFPAGTLSYKGLFVKKGNLVTDWSPAPEDVDASISQIKQTADRVQSQVNDNKGNISSVTQTANAVKADLANTKGDVANVKAKADSLTTQLSDANGNISQLQQTAKGLQSTVAGQDGRISQLQHDADGLNFTVKNMKSGGANMLPAGKLQSYYGSTVTYDLSSDTYTIVNPASANSSWGSGVSLPNAVIEIPWGQTACISMQVYSPTAGDIVADVNNGGDGITGSNDNDNRSKATFHNTNVPANTWTTVWFTYENSNTSRNPKKVSLWDTQTGIGLNLNNVTWKIRHPMVQIGTFPSEWSPSPKDTDSAIAQLKITAKGLTAKVADTEGNVSNLQQTAQGLQTQVTNNKNDVTSLQVKADGIRTDLTNAKNDIASVRVKADGLTTSMANANKQISTLQQRADSITSTLSNGGVNLLNNSRTFGWGITGWNGNPTHTIIDDGDGLKDYKIVLRAGAGNDGFWWPGNNTLNQTYTLSFDAKSDNGIAKLANVGLEQNFLVSNWTALSTGWMRYSVSGKVTHAGNNWVIYFSTTTADNVYVRRVQIEYGDTATPWQPSNGDISSLQQTAQGLTADMMDAKGNISSLQVSAGRLTTDMTDANKNVSSLQQTAKELDAQIKAVDGRATTIKATADGVSARVSRIEGNNVVGSLLKLNGNEAGLGTYVNNKLIAGINTNPDGVCIEGKNIHLNGQTHIDDGVINASKITVYNTVGDNKGNQYLAVAWGQLNSTIGGKDDRGNTLWGSINQTKDKFSSYYTRSDIDNKLSQQSSLISQTAENITAIVNDAKNFATYTVSSSNTWNFDYTKSIYGNWFLNGDTSGNYVYNGPKYTNGNRLTPFMYVTSRGPKDGSRFVVTVWKDNDPTQYQRVWSENKWSEWVILPNSQNLISAINMSPDSVKISGKNIELNGNTKVTGRLDLMQDRVNWVNQSTNYHNNWSWNNAHIYFDNYLQLLGENCNVHYTNTDTHLNGGRTFYSITTLTPGYLKFTTYQNKVSTTDENFDGQITRSYLDSGRLETPEVYTDKFVITGHHIRVRDNKFLMVTNKNGTNFDDYGSVGFQVWGGIVLGQNTIGAPSSELYFQRGNIDAILDQRYSDAPKLTLHAQKVVSQEANSVSSRLSVKTSITKVTYDRALMAVQNTDMYDYKYINDDSSQHYVSGIIDDIHDKPEYNMDPMLINQERTARIDANLLGYHHVVLQEILKRLDKLEAK